MKTPNQNYFPEESIGSDTVGVFDNYKQILKKLNYPNIHNMSEEEILEIFAKENRKFLLTWLGMRIFPDLNSVLNQANVEDEYLMELLCNSGFCTTSQKQHFVTGNSALNIQEQLIIFNRIFGVLERENEEKSISDSTQVDLKSIFKEDINLFPESGSIKKCSIQSEEEVERLRKLNFELLDECAQISKENDFITEMLDSNIEDYGVTLLGFKKVAANISNIVKSLPKETQSLNGIVTLNFSSTGENVWEKLSKEMNTLVKYVNAMKTISECKDENSKHQLKNRKENDFLKIIANLSGLLSDIQVDLNVK